MTRWRTSGRRIFGSGRLTSSKAIVSFIPGEQQGAQRLGVDRVVEGVVDRSGDVVDRRSGSGA